MKNIKMKQAQNYFRVITAHAFECAGNQVLKVIDTPESRFILSQIDGVICKIWTF